MPLFKNDSGASLSLDGFSAEDIGAIPTSSIGIPGGVASLGEDSKVPGYQLPAPPEQIFPTSHIHWWGYSKVPEGKTFNFFVQNTLEFSRIVVISPAALGDSVEFQAILRAGNYRATMIHDRFTDRAVASVLINNNLIGKIDCYASQYSPVNRTYIDFNIDASKLHTFKVIAGSKNPASTGYILAITAIFIYAL